jgi:parallel beta-helix repeat protein
MSDIDDLATQLVAVLNKLRDDPPVALALLDQEVEDDLTDLTSQLLAVNAALTSQGSTVGNLTTQLDQLQAAVAALQAGGTGSGSGTVKFAPGLLVASSEAPAGVKLSAQYVCDGTNDADQINLAMKSAATLRIGQVVLSGGRFQCRKSVRILAGVDFVGQGELSELVANQLGAGHLIINDDANVHAVKIRNMRLNGNGAGGGTGSGVFLDMADSTTTGGAPDTSPDSDNSVEGLHVTNFRNDPARHGIWLGSTKSATSYSRGNTVINCQVQRCGGVGIYLQGSADSFITGCHIGSCDTAGIRVNAGNAQIANTKAYYCPIGIDMVSVRATLVGVSAQDCVTGVKINAGSIVAAGLTTDTSQVVGVLINADRVSVVGLNVFHRPNGRFKDAAGADLPDAAGLIVQGTRTLVHISGVVDARGITTPVTGYTGSSLLVG